MLILVLEASTTSAKAMLYNSDTHESKVLVKTYGKMYDDVTIHKAEQVFMEMAALGKELAQWQDVSVVSLSGTWHSILLCDKNMTPKTPVYLWSHTGAADICRGLRGDAAFVDSYYHKTGCMVNAIYPAYKTLMLKEMGYDLGSYYIMGQGSYNTYRLTGRRVITECLASGTGLLNIHEKKVDRSILDEIGIEEGQLSELVPYSETIPLSDEGAALLGVKAGIPVIPCNSDGGLNQVGVGALEEGVMTFSVGTSGAMRLTTPQALIPDVPSTWCYLSPKSWLSGAATSGCCNCIDWFMNSLLETRGSYVELDGELDAGADTPVFLPFLFGERCPGWDDERRGGFSDITPQMGRRDLYRGVQEGVLYNLYQCYQHLVKLNGKPKKIKLSGGILHSQNWTQMCADIFQEEMEIDKEKQGSLIGGAVLAMELLGVIGDAKDYRPEACERIKPDFQNAQLYAKKYRRYLDVYNENFCKGGNK